MKNHSAIRQAYQSQYSKVRADYHEEGRAEGHIQALAWLWAAVFKLQSPLYQPPGTASIHQNPRLAAYGSLYWREAVMPDKPFIDRIGSGNWRDDPNAIPF